MLLIRWPALRGCSTGCPAVRGCRRCNMRGSTCATSVSATSKCGCAVREAAPDQRGAAAADAQDAGEGGVIGATGRNGASRASGARPGYRRRIARRRRTPRSRTGWIALRPPPEAGAASIMMPESRLDIGGRARFSFRHKNTDLKTGIVRRISPRWRQ
jgi:hypothetical protein